MSQQNTRQNHVKWYSLTAEKVLATLSSDLKTGLTNTEVQERIQKYGRNEIPKGKRRSWFMRLLMQFHNVLIYVLLVSAVVTAVMDHWIDTWVIISVIVINALVGFIQEGKAEMALESIRKMLSTEAVVIRDEKKQTIDAEELVPGDVVFLKSGDKIPADVRLVQARDFRVEESSLTGESDAVEKNTDTIDETAIVGDQLCMAFSSTLVVYGEATGVVVSTGVETEIGRINQMMTSVEEITTPLLQQIGKFGKWLSVIILLVAGAFFAFGYFFRDYTLTELSLVAIGMVVAAIPEGLPAIMTITLAIGVQRMAKRNAIIRRLPSVETLGAVNVICSDKTGTLTRNEMTAKSIITTEKAYKIEGSGYNPQGKFYAGDKEINPAEDKVLWQLLRTARVCNNSEINKDENGHWEMTGTPTEGALLAMSYKAGLQEYNPERIDTIPFESGHKYMATLNKVDDDKFVFLSGAPERLLELCDKQSTKEMEEEIDKEYWEKQIETAAAKGQRLLGFAFSKTDPNRIKITKEDLGRQNTFIGFVGIIDPPRNEAIEAIKECKRAGIEVKMITGDHAITAMAIGKQIGIGNGQKFISGKELEQMSDEEMLKVVGEYDIYARTSPEHKLRLVKALQDNGSLCAMTGDGVNDAPALKKANIGIAMGIKGTEVAKDAAEMVLTDDNFATIVSAIEEGRTVYDNIRKALLFILPTNGAEALVITSAILLGIAMPITPAQILWVNMVTAVTLALALSFEPMENNVMERPPRASGESILGKIFIWRIAFVSAIIGGLTLGVFSYLKYKGLDVDTARTVAVNTLVAGQLFYLFNCRKFEHSAIGKGFFNNRYAFIASGSLIVLQIGFVYLPFMNTFFDTRPINALNWLYPISVGALVFLLVELEKFIMLSFKPKETNHGT
jgi:potassium/sodium efflux P-type ATPase